MFQISRASSRANKPLGAEVPDPIHNPEGFMRELSKFEKEAQTLFATLPEGTPGLEEEKLSKGFQNPGFKQ